MNFINYCAILEASDNFWFCSVCLNVRASLLFFDFQLSKGVQFSSFFSWKEWKCVHGAWDWWMKPFKSAFIFTWCKSQHQGTNSCMLFIRILELFLMNKLEFFKFPKITDCIFKAHPFLTNILTSKEQEPSYFVLSKLQNSIFLLVRHRQQSKLSAPEPNRETLPKARPRKWSGPHRLKVPGPHAQGQLPLGQTPLARPSRFN